jgi:uncharacterized membrane protein YphA (DoxX/SURF4 family)
MLVIKLISIGLPIALGFVMIGHGSVTLAGAPLVRENFARWGYPAGFHLVIGVLEVVVGLLLLIPATLQLGAIGSAMMVLAAVAMQIRSGDREHLPLALALTAASFATIAIHR